MADIDTIMAELKKHEARIDALSEQVTYSAAQNKSIGDLVVGLPEKVWQFPVFRTVGGKRTAIKIIQEFADVKTIVTNIHGRLSKQEPKS